MSKIRFIRSLANRIFQPWLEQRDAVVAALAARGFALVEELWNTTCCIDSVKHLAFLKRAEVTALPGGGGGAALSSEA